MSSASNLCIECGVRPKYVDGTRTHDFCSRTCAQQAALPPPGNCDFCHQRPKYVQGTTIYNYCGKSCARAAQASAKTPTQKPSKLRAAAPSKPTGYRAPQNISSPSQQTLQNACLLCLQRPKYANSNYCGHSCVDEAQRRSPCILKVPINHDTFTDIADQFTKSWRHSGTCPPVKAVYKIVGVKSSLVQYEAYRKRLETRGKFTTAGMSAGNERRRWHGTHRDCKIGDDGHVDFCSATTCSLCCILKSSYKLQTFGKKTGWGRFGAGIYTSSTSSKSNDYSDNGTQSSWKAVMLNKVVVGKGHKIRNDNSSLKSPPPGYDSVLGETGGSLNHDELIVYDEDAIRPSWLVMYAP